MATRQFTNQSTSPLFALSAASDFTTNKPRLEAILKELENASQTGIPTRVSDLLASTQKEETPQTAPASESATPHQTLTTSPQPAPAEPPSPTPPQPPNAVSDCANAYNRAYKESKEKHLSEYDCKKAAEFRYLNTIPRLHKAENITDFVACVAYAMLINVIRPADGTKILYAAQIAAQANQASNKIANRNKSTPEAPK